VSNNKKVLIVGTTSDYIDWLRRVGTGRVLFLTDPRVRQHAKESEPAPNEEILCDLTNVALIRTAVKDHLYRWNISLAGITCFDCESMGLTAFLAEDLGLWYPSVESIRICRDKYTAVSRWQKRSIRVPRFKLARSPYEAADFIHKIHKPCVLKPVSGSGSELVFFCDTESECQRTAQVLLHELDRKKENRLYTSAADCFLVEEFVDGVEYSCDFLIDKKQIKILRFTRKILTEDIPFGTIRAYVLTTCENEGLEQKQLESLLLKAARGLGITRAICMVDFLLSQNEIFLLELTPRPGGDCIPYLMQYAAGLDILQVALDFAEKRPVDLPDLPGGGRYVGLRLHASVSGLIDKISTEKLEADPRVKSIHLIRQSGDRVILPPEDYESWYLGHVIFLPAFGEQVEKQCHELRQLLTLEITRRES
jgi:biotin carboxylase